MVAPDRRGLLVRREARDRWVRRDRLERMGRTSVHEQGILYEQGKTEDLVSLITCCVPMRRERHERCWVCHGSCWVGLGWWAVKDAMPATLTR